MRAGFAQLHRAVFDPGPDEIELLDPHGRLWEWQGPNSWGYGFYGHDFGDGNGLMVSFPQVILEGACLPLRS